MNKFLNKSAVVTGGNGGIGLEICKHLLQQKIKNLAIIDYQESDNLLEQLQSDYPSVKIIFEKTNVAEQIEVEMVYKRIKEAFGQINIVINAAGIVDERNIEKILKVNAGGVIYSSLVALSYMDKSNGGEGGYIINIGSVAGLGPCYFFPIYSTTKYAVLGFTRSMGQEYHENSTGVKFMVIMPGYTKTAILHKYEENLCFTKSYDDAKGILDIIPVQTADNVGRCVIKVIEHDKNGSVWSSEDGKNYEIEVDERRGVQHLYFSNPSYAHLKTTK